MVKAYTQRDVFLLRQQGASLVAATHGQPSLRKITCTRDGKVVNAEARVGWAFDVEHLQGILVPHKSLPQRV
jgi:hypothetical protein